MDLLMSFPGKRRALYFLRNFEPLEEANRILYGGPPSETFACIREMYNLEKEAPADDDHHGMCSDDNLGGQNALCPLS